MISKDRANYQDLQENAKIFFRSYSNYFLVYLETICLNNEQEKKTGTATIKIVRGWKIKPKNWRLEPLIYLFLLIDYF